MASGNDVHLPWNVSDWNLIRWFLNLDILVADKLALFYLQDQLSLDLILYTPHTRTLNFWRECLLIDYLINFHSTGIASVNSDLHAWFDVAASSDDTLDADK